VRGSSACSTVARSAFSTTRARPADSRRALSRTELATLLGSVLVSPRSSASRWKGVRMGVQAAATQLHTLANGAALILLSNRCRRFTWGWRAVESVSKRSSRQPDCSAHSLQQLLGERGPRARSGATQWLGRL